MLKHTYILSSEYHLLGEFMGKDIEEYSHPVSATHISSPIEDEKEVGHLSDGGPHKLTQSNISLAKLKMQDFHS